MILIGYIRHGSREEFLKGAYVSMAPTHYVIDTIWAADLYGIYKASRRRAVVNPIQIGREYCIVLKVRMHLNNQLFW